VEVQTGPSKRNLFGGSQQHELIPSGKNEEVIQPKNLRKKKKKNRRENRKKWRKKTDQVLGTL